MSSLEILGLLVLLSFLPAIGYLAWVRRSERYATEAWGTLLKAFFFGALISTFVSLILEDITSSVFSEVLQPDIGVLPQGSTAAYLFLAIVAAPIIEEGMKALGVVGMKSSLRYAADGMVFGAAVGFGFGFIENTLYGVSAWESFGLTVAILTLFVRSISSILLHGSATAMSGYGVAQNAIRGGRGHDQAAYYGLAVLMHASFNTLVSLPLILPSAWTSTIGAELLSLLTLVIAIGYAFFAFSHVRNRITELQFQAVNKFRGYSTVTAPIRRTQ